MNRMLVASVFSLATVPAAHATIVNIDLSTAATGSIVNAGGAAFAQTFAGQSVVDDFGLAGSPTGPLSLQAAMRIGVGFFNPRVSPAGNSLLSPPNNQGPLAVLLDSYANRFTFTMGLAGAGSTINYNVFGSTGRLVGGGQIVMQEDYAIYVLRSAALFRGISFFDNTDFRGVRFMNMSYNAVPDGVIPEPAAWAMLIAGFALVGVAQRRSTARA